MVSPIVLLATHAHTQCIFARAFHSHIPGIFLVYYRPGPAHLTTSNHEISEVAIIESQPLAITTCGDVPFSYRVLSPQCHGQLAPPDWPLLVGAPLQQAIG